MQVDECIIELVRDSKCLYDKRDENYKNTAKKKKVWTAISEKLKHSLGVDIPAQNIEKRWSSLRNMFNREHKKQSLPPSGSGYKPSKPWDLYQNLLFLLPHIAHRRTTTSFLPIPSVNPSVEENASDCTVQDEDDNNEYDPTAWEFYEDVDASPEIADEIEVDDVYTSTSSASSSSCTVTPVSSVSLSGTFGNRKPLQPINCSNQVTRNTCEKLSNPIFSKNRSGTFTSSLAKNYSSFGKRKFSVPPADQFAKKKVIKRELLEKELDNATSLISTAVTTMTSRANEEKPKEEGFSIIEKGLNKVPEKNKIQCIIELLQVIQKFTPVNAVNTKEQ
ncbi:uncharacterized protein LOC112455835 [Temnothorax curvispinosus]|uniref:Uncharacterized protein LOC112455835 n=1 Tax=Temnothorax curvispinosus TaxID=300111 RepID=A0A6J1PYG6_9HYME|nr:uncharacterized protein LOC112455835 [Temnothorax curvispinosus]